MPSKNRVYLPVEVRAAVWERCGGACEYCGLILNPFRDFSIDHAMPLKHGGDNRLENLVGCCRSCNHDKGDTPRERYLLVLELRRNHPLPPPSIGDVMDFGAEWREWVAKDFSEWWARKDAPRVVK